MRILNKSFLYLYLFKYKWTNFKNKYDLTYLLSEYKRNAYVKCLHQNSKLDKMIPWNDSLIKTWQTWLSGSFSGKKANFPEFVSIKTCINIRETLQHTLCLHGYVYPTSAASGRNEFSFAPESFIDLKLFMGVLGFHVVSLNLVSGTGHFLFTI